MHGADASLTVAEDFRRFARLEARGKSPLYERLAEGVADDKQLLAFLAVQPPNKRQPNLLFAVVRLLFGVQPNFVTFRATILDQAPRVEEALRTHCTQTNEPGRCAPLLPLLAALPQPLALLEVGAAAGLCLLPDRYGYAFGEHLVGPDHPRFPCTPRGRSPFPLRIPDVAWRAGLDLAPVDLADEASVRWLEALVWPEEEDRLRRLREAIVVARRDPPRVVRGDLLEHTAELAAQAPRHATLVVFHTAVLAYLERPQRECFRLQMAALDAVWLSCEAPGVVLDVEGEGFVVARGGREVVARCDPHGRWAAWAPDEAVDG